MSIEEAGLQILKGIADVELDPGEVDKLYYLESPLDMSPAQRAVIIESLRRARAQYIIKKKAKKAKAKKPAVEIEGLTLDDLSLDITKILEK